MAEVNTEQSERNAGRWFHGLCYAGGLVLEAAAVVNGFVNHKPAEAIAQAAYGATILGLTEIHRRVTTSRVHLDDSRYDSAQALEYED